MAQFQRGSKKNPLFVLINKDMINLPVDEGYAFDYLAILSIKADKNPTKSNIVSHARCYNSLKDQIGDNYLWNKIIDSTEMRYIEDANLITYEAVEKARYGEVTAKEVDDANMLRYRAKVALQEKFFGTKPTEYKS